MTYIIVAANLAKFGLHIEKMFGLYQNSTNFTLMKGTLIMRYCHGRPSGEEYICGIRGQHDWFLIILAPPDMSSSPWCQSTGAIINVLIYQMESWVMSQFCLCKPTFSGILFYSDIIFNRKFLVYNIYVNSPTTNTSTMIKCMSSILYWNWNSLIEYTNHIPTKKLAVSSIMVKDMYTVDLEA